jgi:kynureninase
MDYTLPFRTDEAYAHDLDSEDELHHFQSRFYIPEKTIYMDGNSLGLLSRDAEKSLLRALDEWKTLGIQGWLEAQTPWFYYAEKLGALSSALVGAEPEEVVVTGTTTVNLHSLVATFYQPQGTRTKIIADELNFPTDIYALHSQIALKGLTPQEHLLLIPSEDGRTLNEEKIIALMDEEVALVVLPSVLYRSGQLLDMPYLTHEAHERDIPIGFDCSHSVGVIPHAFDQWGVDFAFWCSYKYMNGGPGSTAFLYINKTHFHRNPALTGWFGYVKEKQFDMLSEFNHQQTAGGWQISSPAILSSAPLEGSLTILLEAGIESIRKKSLKMTSYFMYLVDTLLSESPYLFSIGTPRENHRRGGHVAVERNEEAYRISEALRMKGVVPDFRPPNIIRFAPSPLYNTYHDVWQVVNYLQEIIDETEYEKISSTRKAIS